MIYTTNYESPVGKILIAAKNNAIVGLFIEGQKYFLASLREDMTDNGEIPVFKQAKNWLDRYFAGEKPSVKELSLAPEGSDFRKAVWQILCDIPYGKTIAYSDITKKITVNYGLDRMSAQAVGGAVGHNPVSIIIPCHRVIGKNGSLTGYAGGIEIKKKLLILEGVDISVLYEPDNGSAL